MPHEFINIGTGKDLTIKELAEMIKEIVGFKGKIEWDKSKPDGTPQKLLNVSRINKLGWQAKTRLEEGIRRTYKQCIVKLSKTDGVLSNAKTRPLILLP